MTHTWIIYQKCHTSCNDGTFDTMCQYFEDSCNFNYDNLDVNICVGCQYVYTVMAHTKVKTHIIKECAKVLVGRLLVIPVISQT